MDDYYCGSNLPVKITCGLKLSREGCIFIFFEQFADKGRPCSTRKQAYREYTATLLRIGAGGRRVGIQNEGVMRRRAAKRKGGEGPAGVGVPLWDSRRWGEGGGSLFYTILLYNSCLPESYWSILSVCYQREPCMPGATCPTPKVNTHPRSLSPQQHTRRSSVERLPVNSHSSPPHPPPLSLLCLSYPLLETLFPVVSDRHLVGA